MKPSGRVVVVTAGKPDWTVSNVLPLTLFKVAEIVVVPAAMVVARPPELMVAALVLDEFQITWLVRFCVPPSEYVPVAVNCWETPVVFVEFAGVTAMETNVAATPWA